MKFFDSKEEVLDVQLTRYGRQLLSKGVWKPEYYAFFDDNIIYDLKYAGVSTEAKNDAESRIQEKTPLLRTQYSFTGREAYLFDNDEDILDRVKLSMYEKMTVMPLSLGTSTLDSATTPAYKIQFLDGEIDSVEYNMTGNLRTVGSDTVEASTQQLIGIPQIESDIEFKITVFDPTTGRRPRFEEDPALVPGSLYTDNTEVVVGPAQILMVVEEKNASFDYANFDIEVFEITEQTGSFGEPVLEQLSFVKQVETVKDNLLIDISEAQRDAGQPGGSTPEVDPTYVNYYFDINVDQEIDENLICKAISELGSKTLYTDVDIICPDLLDPVSRNIYASDADPEDCPDL